MLTQVWLINAYQIKKHNNHYRSVLTFAFMNFFPGYSCGRKLTEDLLYDIFLFTPEKEKKKLISTSDVALYDCYYGGGKGDRMSTHLEFSDRHVYTTLAAVSSCCENYCDPAYKFLLRQVSL